MFHRLGERKKDASKFHSKPMWLHSRTEEAIKGKMIFMKRRKSCPNGKKKGTKKHTFGKPNVNAQGGKKKKAN